MLTGLSGTYYTPPPQVRVDIPATGSFPGSNQPTAETMMQALVDSQLGYPAGFMSGASGAANPSQLISQTVAYAQSLCQGIYAPWTCQGFDPVARGNYYANLIISILKTIPASQYNQSFTGSVYDAWVQGVPVNIYALPPSGGGGNVLDNVAPNPIYVSQGPVSSVLNPPQPMPPQSSGSGQTLAGLLPAGTSAWLSANWMLVAGGFAALLILPGLMGGRR